MKLSLEANTTTDEQWVPYIICLELPSAYPDCAVTFTLPVHWQHLRDKTVYSVEICGWRFESHTPAELLPGVEKLIPVLIRSARLPTYIFIAHHSRRLYPVYTEGDYVFATTPGGPIFRHIELAKVREYLTDYLLQLGALWGPGNRDRLHVRGVHPQTLQLIRPRFYLKKRAQYNDDNEFWAPVFPAEDDSSLYTYAASARREVSRAEGQEVFQLRSWVSQLLIADRRLTEDYELRADRLMAPEWDQLKGWLQPYPGRLAYADQVLEIYSYNNILIAVEHRRQEDRYSFFLGQDEIALLEWAAQDLLRRGLIQYPEALRYEPIKLPCPQLSPQVSIPSSSKA
jgi:hypothetical protein